MKSKKVTMIAAALVVAVVALAGVGYATTAYHATTKTSNNSLNSTYITIEQNGTGSYADPGFLTKIYYDSETINSTTVKFTPIYDYKFNTSDDETPVTTVVQDTTNGTMAKISTNLTLTIDSAKSDANKINLDVSVTDFVKNAQLKYTLVLATAAGVLIDKVDDVTAAGVWAFTDLDVIPGAESTFVVSLYLSLADNVTYLSEVDEDAGFTNYVVDDPDTDEDEAVAGSIFTFKATASS